MKISTTQLLIAAFASFCLSTGCSKKNNATCGQSEVTTDSNGVACSTSGNTTPPGNTTTPVCAIKGGIASFNCGTLNLAGTKTMLISGAAAVHGFITDGTTLTVVNSTSAIGTYNYSGTALNGSLVSSLATPMGLTSDGTYFYVAKTGNNRVGQHNLTTGVAVNNAFISTGTTSLYGIFTDGNQIVVTDNGGTSSKIYNMAGTSVIATLTGFNGASGVVGDGTYYYISDMNNNRVQKFTTSGTLVNANFITGLNQPSGLTTDGTNLYVGSFGAGIIGKYSLADGSTISASNVTGMNGVLFLATDGVYLFASDNNGILYKIQ